MCAVITHNSVKKRSLYINKSLSYILLYNGYISYIMVDEVTDVTNEE